MHAADNQLIRGSQQFTHGAMVRRTHIKVEVEPPVSECLDQRFHGGEMVLSHEDSRNMSWARGARQYPVHKDLSQCRRGHPAAGKWMEANNYLQMRNNCQGASARCRECR